MRLNYVPASDRAQTAAAEKYCAYILFYIYYILFYAKEFILHCDCERVFGLNFETTTRNNEARRRFVQR